jgi:CRP/FNR family transcriptional regulator, cyclic AMP receptor protein
MTEPDKSLLGAQPFLRGLPDEHLARLAVVCQHVSLPARHRLFEEGETADRFWLLDAGQVKLDAMVPGHGRLIIETLGRGDIVGLSWMMPPYQWGFGAITTQPTQAFEFGARAVRDACDDDPALGYEISRRFSAAVARRLQATRARLLEASARSELAS